VRADPPERIAPAVLTAPPETYSPLKRAPSLKKILDPMKLTAVSRWLFIASGLYALSCAPAILVAERLHWPQSALHLSQFAAVLLCWPASLFVIWRSRALPGRSRKALGAVAASLCSLWMAFVVYVVLRLDFSQLG
jgi:hypothetical protein